MIYIYIDSLVPTFSERSWTIQSEK